MDGHKFINAYFTDEERTIVESLWEDEETGAIRINNIEARDNDPAWEGLLTHIDIDTLHEMTFKRIRDLENEYKEQVIAIAKERGMVYDVDAINSDIYKAIAKSLFSPFDSEKDKEKLFMYKLQLFEEECIKECKDKAAKKKIRQAKTILDATKYAIEIVENTSDTT